MTLMNSIDKTFAVIIMIVAMAWTRKGVVWAFGRRARITFDLVCTAIAVVVAWLLVCTGVYWKSY